MAVTAWVTYSREMEHPHIAAVDVVEGGVVVTYDDASLAFYEESVLLTHLHGTPKREEAAQKTAQATQPRRAMSVGSVRQGTKRERRTRVA